MGRCNKWGAVPGFPIDKSRRSIRNLLDLTPMMAMVQRGKEEVSVPVDEILVGDVVVVRSGERISVDGIVAAVDSGCDPDER